MNHHHPFHKYQPVTSKAFAGDIRTVCAVCGKPEYPEGEPPAVETQERWRAECLAQLEPPREPRHETVPREHQPFQYDPVEAPRHYCQYRVTPVEVAADWSLDFFLGNVVKYICRHREDPQALQKARKYLEMRIELLEKGHLEDTITNANKQASRGPGQGQDRGGYAPSTGGPTGTPQR